MAFYECNNARVTLKGRPALTVSQTGLLLAIWKYETASKGRDLPITCSRLATVLRLKESTVRRIISEVVAISPLYLVKHSVFSQGIKKRGRPVTAYHLNQEGIATFPETGRLLIELFTFPNKTPYRVNREEFEQHLVTLGMDPVVVKDRIATNIRVGYIHELSAFPGFISATDRVESELEYLRSLAKEYNLVNRSFQGRRRSQIQGKAPRKIS